MLKLRNIRFVLPAALLVIALLAAAYVLNGRMAAERANNTVTVMLDWQQLLTVAEINGSSPEAALDTFKDDDGHYLANGILLKELLLSDLQEYGLACSYSGTQLSFMRLAFPGWGRSEAFMLSSAVLDWPDASEIKEDWNYILCYNQEIGEQVYSALKDKTYGQVKSWPVSDGRRSMLLIGTSCSAKTVQALGLGFDTRAVEACEERGLSVVLQMRNFPRCDEVAAQNIVDTATSLHALAMGFNESELPGVNLSAAQWGAFCRTLAEKIKAADLNVMTIEFFSQKGLASLASHLDYEIIRMHPVGETEAVSLGASQLISRFTLAASERNMRLLLVRFPDNSITGNAVFLADLRDGLAAEGLTMGQAVPPKQTEVGRLLVPLLALGVAAGGFWLLMTWGWPCLGAVLAALGMALVGGLVWLGDLADAKILVSLLAAIIFPTLAICLLFNSKGSHSLWRSIGRLLLMSGIALGGALIMAALLSDTAYMQGVKTFSGVKVAQVAPLLLIFIVFWLRQREAGQTLQERMISTWQSPLKLGLAAASVVALAVVVVMLMRSGNDSLEVSSWERLFRSFLDNVLGVRPRTKEFLFAYPLMLLLLYYGCNNEFLFLVPMAAVGQVSLVNTFCHLHTPVAVSLLRTANGLILGIILGVALIFVVRWCLKWWRGAYGRS